MRTEATSVSSLHMKRNTTTKLLVAALVGALGVSTVNAQDKSSAGSSGSISTPQEERIPYCG